MVSVPVTFLGLLQKSCSVTVGAQFSQVVCGVVFVFVGKMLERLPGLHLFNELVLVYWGCFSATRCVLFLETLALHWFRCGRRKHQAPQAVQTHPG